MKLQITKEQFIEMYYAQSYKYIKEKLGLHDYQISNLAKSLGLSKKSGRPKKNIEFKEN